MFGSFKVVLTGCFGLSIGGAGLQGILLSYPLNFLLLALSSVIILMIWSPIEDFGWTCFAQLLSV